MAKSKYAPALFEVITAKQDAKRGARLSLPKWWKREPQQPAGSPAPEAARTTSPTDLTSRAAESDPEPDATVQPRDPSPVVVAVREPEAAARPRPPLMVSDDDIDPPPIIQLREGRVALSLNPVSVAVIVGVTLIALFTSYQLGYRSGRSADAIQLSAQTPAADDLTRAMQGPARPEVIQRPQPARVTPRPSGAARDTGPVAPAAANPPQASANPVTSGRYVVLESFRLEHEQAAEFAQRWLEQSGYRTKLVRRNDSWRQVSEDVFPDEASATRYMQAVQQVGQKLGSALGKAGLPIYYMRSPMQVRER